MGQWELTWRKSTQEHAKEGRDQGDGETLGPTHRIGHLAKANGAHENANHDADLEELNFDKVRADEIELGHHRFRIMSLIIRPLGAWSRHAQELE